MKKFTLALTGPLPGAGHDPDRLSPAGDARPTTPFRPGRPPPWTPSPASLPAWPGQRPASVFVYNGMDAGRQWGIGRRRWCSRPSPKGRAAPASAWLIPRWRPCPKSARLAQAQDLYLQLLICQQAIPVQRGASIYAANFLDCYQISPLDALSLGVKGFNYEGVWGQPDQISWTTSGASLTPLAASAGVSLEPQAAAAAASANSETEADEGIRLPPLLPFGEPAGARKARPRWRSSSRRTLPPVSPMTPARPLPDGPRRRHPPDRRQHRRTGRLRQPAHPLQRPLPPGRRLFLGVRPDHGRGGLPERRLGLEHPLDAGGRFHPGHFTTQTAPPWRSAPAPATLP